MKNTNAGFEYERFYHVYNRTNNGETLFKTDENKQYFLDLIFSRLTGFVKFYSYALLGNHFHFVISVCSEEEVLECINKNEERGRTKTENEFASSDPNNRDIHKLISKQWSRVFNSYTQAINKKFKRKGNLFHAPFKRSVLNNESKLSYLIYYLHHNSRKHGIVRDFKLDPWHSYYMILDDSLTSPLEKNYVLDWYGGRDEFIKFHESRHLNRDFKEISTEE